MLNLRLNLEVMSSFLVLRYCKWLSGLQKLSFAILALEKSLIEFPKLLDLFGHQHHYLGLHFLTLFQ
jgi:hypothetical protein